MADRMHKTRIGLSAVMMIALIIAGAIWSHKDRSDDATRDLLQAIDDRDLDAARDALDRGAKIEGDISDGLLIRSSVTGIGGTRPLLWAIYEQDLEMIRMLLDEGADIENSLALAVRTGNGQVVQLLIDSGAAVDGSNRDGGPLRLACLRGVDVTKRLLNSGANPKRPGVLASAAVTDNGTLPLLLNLGIDADQPDERGRSPIEAAAGQGLVANVLLLIEAGADPSGRARKRAADGAVRTDDVDMLKCLLDAGVEPSLSLLERALGLSSIECTRELLDRGVPVRNLMYAYGREGRDSHLHVLVQAGADVDVADGFGRTAILGAAEEASLSTVKLLVGLGGEVNPRDDEGCTPLMRLTELATSELAHFLIEAGADPNAIDNEGRSVVDHLQERCSREVVGAVRLGILQQSTDQSSPAAGD